MSAVETLTGARPDQHSTRPTFAAAAAAHLDDVYRYLLYLTKDGTLAEDLTADTFERALRGWQRFDPRRGSARTWLCQLARSTALDHFRAEERRRRRDDRYARDEPRSAPSPGVPGLSPALEDALGRLSAADRELIALRVVLELDTETAARDPRHQHHRLLDPAQPRTHEAPGGDRRCPHLTTAHSSRSCAARHRPRRTTCGSASQRSPQWSRRAPPRCRERLSLRRLMLVAAPTAAAVLLAVAVVHGVDSAFEPTPEAAVKPRREVAREHLETLGSELPGAM